MAEDKKPDEKLSTPIEFYELDRQLAEFLTHTGQSPSSMVPAESLDDWMLKDLADLDSTDQQNLHQDSLVEESTQLNRIQSIPKPVHPLDDLLKNLLEKGLISAPTHVNADDVTELSLKGRAIKAVEEVDLDRPQVPLVPSRESLPERPGVPDCPYFLKTQKCKFNHPKDTVASQSAVETVDVSLLPERPSEPPCTFYITTGRCKFGAACKFHHPKDIEVPQANEENDNGFQTESAVKNGGIVIGDATPKPFTPFTPASLHNSKGLPVKPGEVDCPFYLKTGSCKYGATCCYNHPDRNVINLSVAAGLSNAFISSPAANLNFGVINPAASILPAIDPRLAQTTPKEINSTRIEQRKEDLHPLVTKGNPSETTCSAVLKARLQRGNIITTTGNQFFQFHYTDGDQSSSFPLEDDILEKIVRMLDIDSIFSMAKVSPIYLDIWRNIKDVKMLEEPVSRSAEQILKLFRIFVDEKMKLNTVEVHSSTAYFSQQQAEELFDLVRELAPTKIVIDIHLPPKMIPSFGLGVNELTLRNCGSKLDQPRFLSFGLDHLTELILEKIQLDPNRENGEFALRVPTLKTLKIDTCIHNAAIVNRFHISCENLLVLSIRNAYWCKNENLTLEVSSRGLRELDLIGYVYRGYNFSASNAVSRASIVLEGDVRSLDLVAILNVVGGCSQLILSNNSCFDPLFDKSEFPTFDRLRFVLVEGFSSQRRRLLSERFNTSGVEVVSRESRKVPKPDQEGFFLQQRKGQ